MGKSILISRTDSIGDVILTLPVAGVLKSVWPDSKISFLGNQYTKPIITSCNHIETFMDVADLNYNRIMQSNFDIVLHVFPNKPVADLCKTAGIPIRIGTSHRYFHWFTCNKLVNLTRKRSDLHEAQLNVKLLKPLRIRQDYTLKQLSEYYGWKEAKQLQCRINHGKFNIIFHMKSKGSAAEWPVKKYAELANKLDPASYDIYITGTESEGRLIRKEYNDIFKLPHVIDVTGKFNLSDFISFVRANDGLVACSTGPLHIAAANDVQTLGLFPNVRPMHAGRWAPLGKYVETISSKINLSGKDGRLSVEVEDVFKKITAWKKN